MTETATALPAGTTPVGAAAGSRSRRAWFRTRGAASFRAAALTPAQTITLGVLLLAVQIPQAPHLPLWIAVAGALLVVLRIALLQRDRARPGLPPTGLPSWTLVVFAIVAAFSVRTSYGYLIGRDPSVAFLYILVAIKFLEARSVRDGSLLICLSAFLLITPFFSSQSPLAALACLPAVLMIGITLDALTNPRPTGARVWLGAARRSGLMMLQGAPVAILLFVLFPRLAAPLWGLPQDTGAQSGLSESMAPGQISELSLSDEVAFRVDFDGAIPPSPLRYWRGPVLSRFDGRVWSALLPVPGGRMPPYTGEAVSYTVMLEPSHRLWLFALEQPAALPQIASGPNTSATDARFATFTRDQQLLARSPVSHPLRYSQLSVLEDSYPGELAAEARINLSPGRGNARTMAFARELRAQHPGDADYARAVLAFFREQSFVYTLSPPLMEQDPVDVFLFDTRRGFCEHYASAFVVLLRAAGIPSRVVTGYQGGEINPRGGYMIVRQSDAHAWAEALIDGRWRRYDPTGAVAPSRIELGLGGALPVGEPVPFLARLDPGWAKNLRLVWDSINHDWRRNVVGFNYERQRALWREWHIDHLAAWQFVTIAAGVVFAWAGAVVAWLLWKRRRQERALVLWEKLCRRLARAGMPRFAHEGPLDYAGRAAQRWPQFAIAFAAIGECFAELRYGRAPSTAERAALTTTLGQAIAVLPRAARLRNAGAQPGGR